MNKSVMEKCNCSLNVFGLFYPKEKSFLLGKTEYEKLLPDDECGICLELLKASPCIKTENCDHIFHKYCYRNYVKQTGIKKKLGCPFCNSNQDNLNSFVFESDK